MSEVASTTIQWRSTTATLVLLREGHAEKLLLFAMLSNVRCNNGCVGYRAAASAMLRHSFKRPGVCYTATNRCKKIIGSVGARVVWIRVP